MTWAFEPVAEAKRNFDRKRVELMRILAEWTTGDRSYDDGVDGALDDLAQSLQVLTTNVRSLNGTEGAPRVRSRAPLDSTVSPRTLFAENSRFKRDE